MLQRISEAIGRLFGSSRAGSSLGMASSGSGRGRLIFLVAPVVGLALALAIIAVAGGSGGDNDPEQAAVRTPTARPNVAGLAGTATAAARNTAIAADLSGGANNRAGVIGTPGVGSTPGAPSTATRLPDRTDCEAIRATEYRSDTERSWFLANCAGTQALQASAQAANTPVSQSSTQAQQQSQQQQQQQQSQQQGQQQQQTGGQGQQQQQQTPPTNTPGQQGITPTAAPAATNTPLPPTATTVPPTPTTAVTYDPRISFSPSSIRLGQTTDISGSGSGFPPNAELTLIITGCSSNVQGVSCPTGGGATGVMTDASGRFEFDVDLQAKLEDELDLEQGSLAIYAQQLCALAAMPEYKPFWEQYKDSQISFDLAVSAKDPTGKDVVSPSVRITIRLPNC